MNKLLLSDLDLSGKRVLMRVDFNVPLDKTGKITDDTRIRAAVPSIQYVLKHRGKLILMSHLGRPKGIDSKLSLKRVAEHLTSLLGQPVLFAPDCVGPEVEAMTKKLKAGEVLLLENLRFHSGEEEPVKEPSFVEKLASLGEVYVNDAFGTAHRAHASTALIASYFPHKAAAGFLMQKEIDQLSPLLDHPPTPFYAILGGAKISTKIGVIQTLLSKVDALFLGGGMVFTFLKAQGLSVGESLIEEGEIDQAKQILKAHSKALVFPLDFVIADAFSDQSKIQTIPANQEIPNGWRGMDVGPQTIQAWTSQLKTGATIFWNGPLGVFEMAPFAKGTRGLAEALTQMKAKVIAGGGDSVAAIEQMGLGSRFAHLSTGGGATLEWIEFGHLPGIDALSDKT